MNISATFIHRPIATVLLMAGLLLGGLVTYRLLPVASLPNVNFPTISVTARLPGADPQTMASSVATPLEQQFSQIPGLTQLTSANALGYTQLTVQFDLSRDIDSAATDVLAAINAATPYLPTGIPYPPTIRKVNPADTPILVLGLTSDTLPLTTVDAFTENILVPKLSQIGGVGLIGIGGQQKPAIRVQVDPQALANRGIGLEDVRNVLMQANVDQPKGTLNSPHQTFTLGTNDQLLKPDAYKNLIVAYRNGAPVHVSDVGNVIEASENNQIGAFVNKQPAIILAIQRQPGANVIQTVDLIKSQLPQLQAALPPGIKLDILSDRTQTIRASVSDVQFTLLLTVALVVMVIFVFLRNFWATVIPAITVPLSLIGTFAALYALGYSLDNLSLMALSIAIGFVVDDAVVVIENIVRHLEAGLSPMEAALRGSREIGFTIISITLSLIAVFIPLFLMGGYAGKLFQEFAITVSVSLILSLVISLTLTPMMCSRLLKHDTGKHGWLYRQSERAFDGLLAIYERGLKVALRHRFITLMTMFLAIAVTGYLYVVIPKGFFPQQDTGLIVGVAEAAQDISYPAMSQRMHAVIAKVVEDPAVLSVGSAIGAGGGVATVNQGRVFITLKPREQRDASADGVINRLRTRLASVEGITLYMQAAQDITVGARLAKTQFQYTLTDSDQNELNHWSAIFLDKLKSIPEIADVTTDQENAGPRLDVAVNREVASSFGILPSAIDNTLDDAFGQRIVSTIFTSLNQYHVVLEVLPRFQTSPTVLQQIYLNSSNGQQVPLSTLTKSTVTAAPIVINHQGMFPSTTISFNLKPGAALGTAVAAIQQFERTSGKPLSLATTFQGNANAFQAALSGELVLVLAALIVIYIILGVLYESFIHPITILSTLPSAGIGALLLLIVVHMDLSVIAIIGIILLIGIVKKNGIMLVDFALEVERNEGLTSEQSIYQACVLRFRPILMTTMAALLGGVPLMLGTGTGSEIRQPLGYTIVGGLILSQLLTLFTTPVVYLYLDRLQQTLRGRPAPAQDAASSSTAA
ncbi:efflux RND transporter permease subunit [Bradyrhizobium canariense]|uniref:Acriflavine resistance protein B n=1 Tax=Bradyrhizobium canariense TaxID=255045 RepID=A0A1X3GTK6_9BRAD|nr:efflux RND transporter permease subunit [Bradyrhizobium canariense]OSI76540.1 acriflavine resistance protein B [Bradyrhizobium canariense]OSI81889.1 acriflavine resistance protein B [Bradyrhizobium canariense]OSI89981.1 acriflavine resistance protein B [Bradyrhizobium canariense]OSI96500.1 acriflavine resistance protein B [Bradyrhizobium canariense]OSJ01866.1 acriflavine resistance protein B [Bradyrhizobium canariense]